MALFLDVRTLTVVMGTVILALSFCMGHYSVRRKTYPGFGLWTIGTILVSFAFFLVALREILPRFITIVMADALICSGLLLFYLGLKAVAGKKVKPYGHLTVVFLSSFVLIPFFTYVMPSVNARISLISFIAAVYFFLSTRVLVREIQYDFIRLNKLLPATLILMSTLFLFRGSFFLLPGNALAHYLSAGIFHGIALLAIIILGIFFVIGLMHLNTQMLERELYRERNQLKENEEKFRLTFNAGPDAVNVNRLKDGLYVDINDGFTQLTGFTREDVAGKTSLDINIWHDPGDRMKLVRALEKKGFCNNLEAQFRKKDGGLTTALMSARVVSIKDEPHIISITRDISERKQAEAERVQLLLAIEQATEIVVITDASGTIRYVNPAFEKITGYSNGEAVGENPRLLKSDRQNRAFYKSLWDTILAGKPWKGRLINKRKDGAHYTAECSISPIKDEDGSVVNFVWISRDITNELELEKRVFQAQKMESIGNLAGGIAHDFNNILFPIIAISEMLLEDFAPNTLKYENVRQILKAGERGRDLVQHILSFSRQSEDLMMPVQVQQILKEVLKLSRSTIPSNIEITGDMQENCGLVMANATQLHQIAMNLITNSYHAVEETGGKISIRVRETVLDHEDLSDISLEPGPYAMLSVTDTGCGIDPAVMEQIFDPYFTTKARGKGTGLGLAVVYGIVKKHHGDIKVHSKPGEGTTVKVYLPLLKKSPEPVTVEKAQKDKTGNERVLLVDDEKSVVYFEKQLLERLGYQVTGRESSLDALRDFRADPDAFDLVITDMSMPNMTGDQLACELMSIRPDIPIIICTGFSEKINDKRAKTMGIKGFLMKPVNKSDLTNLVRKILDEAKNPNRD